MKLYANVSSERATKGQGGNKYLDIIIQVGKARQKIAKLKVKPFPDNSSDNIFKIELFDFNSDIPLSSHTFFTQTKGKKKKSERECGCGKGTFCSSYYCNSKKHL